jgi:plasmid stabilization system protein ParE
MKIEWSPEAAADFAGIVAYIHKQNPSAADRVAHTMFDSAASLESFPIVGGQAELVTLANSSWHRFHLSSSIELNGTS